MNDSDTASDDFEYARRVKHDLLAKGSEALEDMISNDTHPHITELPQEYQWLRISLNQGKDSPTKKVIHWTGPVGREHIRKNLK